MIALYVVVFRSFLVTISLPVFCLDKIVKSDNDLCFKNPIYRELGFAKNAKVWKSLKQIMALQKSQSSTDSVSCMYTKLLSL